MFDSLMIRILPLAQFIRGQNNSLAHIRQLVKPTINNDYITLKENV